MQIRFGLFEFDLELNELRREGVLVKLQAQPAQVLRCLLERAGQVVSREELHRAVWRDDTFVDFERGLNFCIAQIRSALNDTASESRFVRTIPKRGYQFIAPVARSGAKDLVQEPSQKPRSLTKLLAGIAAASVLLAISFASCYWVKQSFTSRRPIVAVLRFDNETGSPEVLRFSDAVTDLLTTELAANADGHYRVIGNARILRLPREQRDLNAVASSLGASYVILGQVQGNGAQARVLAHLIHLPDQTHVSVTRVDHDLDDPLALESEVAKTIAGKFSPRIRPTFVPLASSPRASL